MAHDAGVSVASSLKQDVDDASVASCSVASNVTTCTSGDSFGDKEMALLNVHGPGELVFTLVDVRYTASALTAAKPRNACPFCIAVRRHAFSNTEWNAYIKNTFQMRGHKSFNFPQGDKRASGLF